MQPTFIDHIVLIIKNVEETESFYTKFLGAPLQVNEEQVCYKIGDTKIFFGLPYGDWEATNKDHGGLNHLAFGVRTRDELEQCKEKLESGEIKNSGIQIDKYGGKEFIWLDDPNGIRLEFYMRPTEEKN